RGPVARPPRRTGRAGAVRRARPAPRRDEAGGPAAAGRWRDLCPQAREVRGAAGLVAAGTCAGTQSAGVPSVAGRGGGARRRARAHPCRRGGGRRARCRARQRAAGLARGHRRRLRRGCAAHHQAAARRRACARRSGLPQRAAAGRGRVSPAPGAEVRATAARVLDGVLHRGRSLKAELGGALPALDDPRDRALLEAIVFAALRRRGAYDAALAAWMSKPPERRDAPLRALLYTGFAQLDALQLPAHAAVAATVEAARVLGRAHQAGLVNALLRRASREGLAAGDPAGNWPAWLLDALRQDWPDAVDDILAASAQTAPMWLRVNRRRGTPDDYRARLAEAGIAATHDPACVDGL